MSSPLPISADVRRPARLLTQNSEMRQIGVWNWSLPAWAGRLPDGRTYNTCLSAGICAQVCYARSARNFIYCKALLPVIVGISKHRVAWQSPEITTRSGDLPDIFRLMKDPFNERKDLQWIRGTVSIQGQPGWNCLMA